MELYIKQYMLSNCLNFAAYTTSLFLGKNTNNFLRMETSDFNNLGVLRPGDTILIAAGGVHLTSNIRIDKPICLIGGGDDPEETTLVCSRGSDSALEFLSTCKISNLTVRAELGCCLLHRKGRLIIDNCLLQCESNPLDYLSCPIVTTAISPKLFTTLPLKAQGDSVAVSCTRIEGGAKAVLTSGNLALQRVRVIYARASVLFWFDLEHSDG
ncbi:hypothetical protein V2J09_024136 [Rumex salicifolius]